MIIDETDNEFLYEKYYKPLYAPIGDKNFIGNTVIELKYCEIFDISSKNGILQVYKNIPKLVNTSMMRIKLNDYKRGKRSFLINKIINESNIK